MKLNKKALQKELDLAAEELEVLGHTDLADMVDHYNDRLMKSATVKDVNLVRRALQRIEKEASRREDAKHELTPERKEQIKNAIARAQKAASEKKAAKAKEQEQEIQNRKQARSERLQKDASNEVEEVKEDIVKTALARKAKIRKIMKKIEALQE